MDPVNHPLYDRFPPSKACSCTTCISFCRRPGWPLVEEMHLAIDAGLASHLMLEFSPNLSFGILAPAFFGKEGMFALTCFSNNYCTFFDQGRCALFGLPYRPLECRFCHHERIGQGKACHLALAHEWNTSKGKRLVHRWLRMMQLSYPDMPALGLHLSRLI